MLTLQFARTGYVVDLDELRYADQTGDYDAALNPGGYGGPNPARESLALYLVAEMPDSAGLTSALLDEPDGAGDPLTRATFALRPGRDGYAIVRLLAFTIVEDIEPLGGEEGDVFYDAATSRLRRLTGEQWLPVTAAACQRPVPRTAMTASTQEALTSRAQALRELLTERVAAIYFDGQADAYQNAADQHLLRLDAATRALLAGADICWRRNQPYLFALRVERLTTLAGEAAPLLA